MIDEEQLKDEIVKKLETELENLRFQTASRTQYERINNVAAGYAYSRINQPFGLQPDRSRFMQFLHNMGVSK